MLTGAVSAICSNLLLLWIAGGIESLLLIYLCRKRKLSAIFYCYVIVCLLAMITSYARTSENITKSFYENQLEESNGKQVNIKGNVKKITQQNGYMQLMLQNCQIHIIDENIDLKQAGVLVTVSSFSGINGDTVELNGKLKCFERSRNPGEFDSRVYYHSLGLDYRCQAYNLEIVKHADYGLERIAQIVRTHMNTVFNVVAPEDAGILESVILGNRENLDQSTKEMYQISGIAHLLAISGLHISIIGMTLYRLLRKLFPFLSSAVLAGFVMLVYLYMTGNGISAFRAIVMFLIAMLAEVLGRTYDISTALSIAGLLLILSDGRVLINNGFQLSFAALAGICWVYPALLSVFHRSKSSDKTMSVKLQEAILMSMSVQLSTLPVILLSYYQFPVYGFLLNLVVIPLMSLVVVGGILSGLAGIFSMSAAGFFIGISHSVLQFYKWLCSIYVKIPGAVCVMGKPSETEVFIYIAILCLFMFYASFGKNFKQWKKLMAAGVLVISVVQMKQSVKKGMVVQMIDVGQGDSIFMQTETGFTCLFDGGSTDIKHVGEKRILPMIKSQGVNHLDYVFVSHSDADHINGLIELIESMDCTFHIEHMIFPDILNKEDDENYQKLIVIARKAGIRIGFSSTGDKLEYGKHLTITCLHPEVDYPYESANDYSAVYFVQYQNFRMLMTGDAEKHAEQDIMAHLQENQLAHINVLKVGHHGSSSSTSDEFLAQIKPQTALISCGIWNSYGHPHEETIQHLESSGSRIYVTNQKGAIRIDTDGDMYEVRTFLR